MTVFVPPHKLTMTRMCTVVSNVSLSNIGNLDTITASGKKMTPHVRIKTDSCSRKRKKKIESQQILLKLFLLGLLFYSPSPSSGVKVSSVRFVTLWKELVRLAADPRPRIVFKDSRLVSSCVFSAVNVSAQSLGRHSSSVMPWALSSSRTLSRWPGSGYPWPVRLEPNSVLWCTSFQMTVSLSPVVLDVPTEKMSLRSHATRSSLRTWKGLIKNTC